MSILPSFGGAGGGSTLLPPRPTNCYAALPVPPYSGLQRVRSHVVFALVVVTCLYSRGVAVRKDGIADKVVLFHRNNLTVRSNIR